jgi:hypothetical protein
MFEGSKMVPLGYSIEIRLETEYNGASAQQRGTMESAKMRQSNVDRAQWRVLCRERLSEHICE